MEDVAIELPIKSYMLRSWRHEDKSALVKYANNRNIWRNMRDEFPTPYREEDAENWLKKAVLNKKTMLAISSNTESIGSISIVINDDIRRLSGALSYWVGEPFWGKGIATESVKTFTNYIFENFEIIRIYAKFFASNTASKRALEKAGFIMEGNFKKAIIKEGKILDQYLYAITR